MGFSLTDFALAETVTTLAGRTKYTARCNETPFASVFTDRHVTLRDYGADDADALPVLIEPPLAANSAMFDMHPDASAIKILKAQGLRVYFLDLGDPSYEDRNTSLEDYLAWIKRAMATIRTRHNISQVDLIGYCLGGVLSLFYASRYDDVNNLVLINTPVDFAGEVKADDHQGSLMMNWPAILSGGRLGVLDMPLLMYNMSGAFNTRMYQMIQPLAGVRSRIEIMRRADDREFVEHTLSLKQALQMTGYPGRANQQHMHNVVTNAIAQGSCMLGGELIDLKNIKTPMLCTSGTSDSLVPPSALITAANYTSSPEIESFITEGGHVSAPFSRRTVADTFGKISQWLLAHR